MTPELKGIADSQWPGTGAQGGICNLSRAQGRGVFSGGMIAKSRSRGKTLKKASLLEYSGKNTNVAQITPVDMIGAGRELAKWWNNPEFQYF